MTILQIIPIRYSVPRKLFTKAKSRKDNSCTQKPKQRHTHCTSKPSLYDVYPLPSYLYCVGWLCVYIFGLRSFCSKNPVWACAPLGGPVGAAIPPKKTNSWGLTLPHPPRGTCAGCDPSTKKKVLWAGPLPFDEHAQGPRSEKKIGAVRHGRGNPPHPGSPAPPPPLTQPGRCAPGPRCLLPKLRSQASLLLL